MESGQLTFSTEEAQIEPEHDKESEWAVTSEEGALLYTDILKEQIIRALCEDTVFEASNKGSDSGISSEVDSILQTAEKEDRACWGRYCCK